MYKCSYCDFSSEYRSSVVNHINKGKKCCDTDVVLEVIKLNVEIKCDYCNKILCNKNSKIRHLKICKEKKLSEQEKDKIIDEKDKIIEELEEQITELSSKLSGTTINKTVNSHNNNTTNNTINNNTNYITISLTPYNDPNMEGIQEYLEIAIKKTLMSIPSIIENVHFNDKYPENKNISITNKRANHAKVFNGKRWETVDKDRLLNEIVDTYERELTTYAEEQGNTKFIENYETAKKQKNAEKELINNVHNTIYDNSEKVNTKIKETRKTLIEDMD
jgi:hypothetical protein